MFFQSKKRSKRRENLLLRNYLLSNAIQKSTRKHLLLLSRNQHSSMHQLSNHFRTSLITFSIRDR